MEQLKAKELPENIKKIKSSKKTTYQLHIKPSDTNQKIYIKQSQNLQEIIELNNKITAELPLTTKQLIKYKNKKPTIKSPTVSKYIVRVPNQYGYSYNIRKQGKSFACFKTLEEAEIMRDKLVRTGWDESLVEELVIRRETREKYKYIIKTPENKYVVRRKIGDRFITFDSGLRTLEEAVQCRDWWSEHGWDFDTVDLD